MSVAVNHRISPCYEWNKNRHRSRSENDCESCGKPAGGRRKRPRKLAASDINSISSTSSGSRRTLVWPRSRRLPGASVSGFTNCSPQLPCPGLAPANRLPPQKPSPNPGNGTPRENVRENYPAVVASAAGLSAMLVWAGPHCFRQRAGFSALVNGCSFPFAAVPLFRSRKVTATWRFSRPELSKICANGVFEGGFGGWLCGQPPKWRRAISSFSR